MSFDFSRLADEITTAARLSANETDLRIRIEPLIDRARAELGFTADAEREKSLDMTTNTVTVRGRADTVYGAVIIEYEPPRGMATASGLAHAVKQVRDYMWLTASKAKARHIEALRRLGGVATDGSSIAFLRATGPYIAGSPTDEQLETLIPIEGPFPISGASIQRLALYFRALARKPLEGHGLAKAFGPTHPGTDLASAFVSDLVGRLEAGKLSPRATLLQAEWKRSFGAVYIQDASKARQDAALMALQYGVRHRVGLDLLLFAVQTYYALLMKLLAMEVLSLQQGSFVPSLANQMAGGTPAQRQRLLREMESGALFAAYGIENYLEADYFAWYLEDLDGPLDELVRRVASELTAFEPATSTLDPDAVRDLLKVLYQFLLPKKIRHDLGEYYTPDWLADYLMDQAGYDGGLGERVLDPACGSGTFLMRAISRMRAKADGITITDDDVAKAIVSNITGFDLNPVAVLAARTNYLLALGPLIRKATPLTIPIFLADSLLAPLPYSRLIASKISSAATDHYVRASSVGDFRFPMEVADPAGLALVTEVLEDAIKSDIGPDAFVHRIDDRRPLVAGRTKKLLAELYEKVARLNAEGRDSIWATLLRNAFAPAFAGRFDLVLGNPPWINWESLSDEYRQATRRLWELHGLFTLSGLDTLLGGSKRDIAMLFWVAAADYYLTNDGTIAFLLPQTILHTSPAGDGFRRFALGDTTPVGVSSAHDLVDIQPFEGASNWTAALIATKGRDTTYPVPYRLFHRAIRGRIRQEWDLSQVLESVDVADLVAAPVDAKDRTSPWLIGTVDSVAAGQSMVGANPYEARAGFMTWADGIYYGMIEAKRSDGLVVFRNDAQRAKARSKPTAVTQAMEPDYLFPVIDWSDLKRFSAVAKSYALIPQDPTTRQGFSEAMLRVSHPKTYDYLARFKSDLQKRSGWRSFFKGKGGAFYSIFGFGAANLAPVRVVWATMGTQFRAAVVEEVDDPYLGRKPPLHKNTAMFVPMASTAEAHYLCALLNSTPMNYLAVFSSVRGGKSFGSGGLVDRIRIAPYDPGDSTHVALSESSRAAHQAAASGDSAQLADALEAIDLSARDYWRISPAALSQMTSLLASIGRGESDDPSADAQVSDDGG